MNSLRNTAKLLLLSELLVLSAQIITAEPEEFLTDPACKTTLRDIAYLPKGRADKMDIYLSAGAPSDTKICFLYIHGGGWFSGDKYKPLFFTKLCVPLLQNGFVVASINYNMTEKPLWPQNINDCKTAVQFLKTHAKEYGIDPDCIVVGGTSAGGHLALMTALSTNNPGVAGCVDFCGVTDIRRIMPQHKPRRWGNILFNGSPDAVPDDGSDVEFPKVWETASPVCQVHADSVPLLLVHGLSDDIVEPDHAEELYSRASMVEANCTFFPVENVGHGISLCTPEVMNRVAEFIQTVSN